MIDETVYKRNKKAKDAEEQGGRIKCNNQNITVKSLISIGRDSSCDIVIENDPLVSRKHAIIEKDKNNALFLTDKGSTNGTYVNNNPIPRHKKVLIKKGDSVLIGKTELKVVP